MNIRGKQIQVIVLLSVLLVGFNHCIVDFQPKSGSNKRVTTENTSTTSNNTFNNNTNTGGNNSVPDTPEEEIVAQQVDVGVKNFDQINNTFSALTGISVNQNNVRNLYEDVSTQLPTENDVKSFLGSSQVAIAKLASEYCDRLVRDGNLRSQVWPMVNFGRTPASEFNNVKKDQIVNQTIDHFWSVAENNADRPQNFQELRILFDDLLMGENLNSTTTTRNTMMGICTAALASAHVTLL